MFGCAASALFVLSCGGSGRTSDLAPAASAGDEPPPTAAEPASTEPEKPARGRIVVEKATCAGQPVAVRGRMPIERELVVDFDVGQEFSAEAGTRHIEVTMLDDILMVDKPTLQLEVPVEPNKLAKVNAVFPWAKVQLELLVRGTVQPPTPIKLIRKGNVVAEVKSSSPAFLVTPGNYEAEATVRGKKVRVKGLVFFEGTDQKVPVRAEL
jgi:hypothetical protein